MEPTLVVWLILSLGAGGAIGYGSRVFIAKKRTQSIESKIESLKEQYEYEKKNAHKEAQQEADRILENARLEAKEVRKGATLLEETTIKRENDLERRVEEFEKKREELKAKAQKVKDLYREAESMREEQVQKLAEIAQMSEEDAKRLLMNEVEQQSQEDLMVQIDRLEGSRRDSFVEKARNIMVLAMQRYAQEQVAEFTTSTISLPSEEVKGKIIGKEGRNIRALENTTGVQIVVDEAPDTIMLSCFDPIRRNIAKLAIERLIEDGRIHPARIEEFVAKAKESIHQKIKEAGEAALYDTGITGIDRKLVYILGRLRFRTSYSQNVLMHSIEVSHLAGAIAAELGADVQIAKIGGLFHDVGKALDHEVEGTHVEIGRALLEKYRVKKEVIQAMQSHHEEYPYETLESRIVQVADALSASRPGARRDSVDNYIKRLGELESISNQFEGVERTYAINAGREVRVFVTPSQISDIQAKKMARDIALRIEEELRYPGEIKVTLIRETRIIDYAR